MLSYDYLNLIVDIGSSLGLWIGASALDVCSGALGIAAKAFNLINKVKK